MKEDVKYKKSGEICGDWAQSYSTLCLTNDTDVAHYNFNAQ